MGMMIPSVQVSIPVKSLVGKSSGPSKRKLTNKLAASSGKTPSKADKVAGNFPGNVPVTSSFVSELHIVHNRASPFVMGGGRPDGNPAKKSKHKGAGRKSGRTPAAVQHSVSRRSDSSLSRLQNGQQHATAEDRKVSRLSVQDYVASSVASGGAKNQSGARTEKLTRLRKQTHSDVHHQHQQQ